MEDLTPITGETPAEALEAAAVAPEEKPWLAPYEDIVGFRKEAFEKFDKEKERGVIKSYIEMTKKAGSAINIPEEGDTDGWNDVYSKLGRPEAPEQYELPATEGVEQNDDYKAAIQKAAFDNGLSAKQLAAIAKVSDGFIGAANTAQAEANETLNNTRWEKLGWDESTKTENTEIVRRAIAEFEDKAMAGEDDSPLSKLLLNEEGKLGNDPKLIAFAKFLLDKQLDDKGIVHGSPAGGKEEPAPPHGPTTYQFGDSDNSKAGRAYYEKRGFNYATLKYDRAQ